MALGKTQIHTLIAVVGGLLIYFLVPPVNGLTVSGVSMLAVFLPTVYLWLAVGTAWPSLLSVTMAVLLMAANGVDAFGTLWGSIVVCAIIPFMMVAGVLEESGAFEWIVKWMISRKFVHGRPTLFMVMFTLAMIIISIFTAPQVVSVLFLTVLANVCKTIGYDKGSPFYRAHGLLVGWIAQISDGILIWGRPYVLAVVGIIVGLGFVNFTAMDYFMIAGIYLVFAAIVAMLTVKFVIRPDVSKFEHYDDAAIRQELADNPINRKGKIALAGMVIILVSYALAYMTFLGGIATYFTAITIAAPVSFVCAMLCVITVDKKPVMDLGKSLANVPWTMIVFLGAIMFYAGNLNGADYGITLCLTNILGPIVQSIPLEVTIFLGLVVAAIVTNFCSNTVAAVAVCSSFIPAMLSINGVDPATVLTFACCVTAICGTAFCTPAAAPTMSIIYSDMGIEYKGTAKYSVLVCAVLVLFSMLVLMPFCSGLVAGVAVLG